MISTTVVRYKASDKKKLKFLRSGKIIFEFLVRNHPETTQNSPSCQIQHPPNTTSEPAAEIEKSVYILQNTEMVILKARQGSRPGAAGGCPSRQRGHDRVAQGSGYAACGPRVPPGYPLGTSPAILGDFLCVQPLHPATRRASARSCAADTSRIGDCSGRGYTWM